MKNKNCKICGIKIDRRATHCNKCRSRSGKNNPFYQKKHTKATIAVIGKKSKAKFTKKYLENLRSKAQGNKKRDINGYTLIKDYNHPDRNSHNDMLEHRLVMEKMIGRRLTKTEIVHHKNFIRNDNRKNNLHLYANHSEHHKASKSIFELVDNLLKQKIIKFKNGRYQMNKRNDASVVVGGKS